MAAGSEYPAVSRADLVALLAAQNLNILKNHVALGGSGGYSTPDASDLDLASGCDIRVRVSQPVWGSGATQTWAAHWDVAGNRGWFFGPNASGLPFFQYSVNGTSSTTIIANAALTDTGPVIVRALVDPATGGVTTVNLYKSTDGGQTWQLLKSGTGAVGPFFASTAPVTIGGYNSGTSPLTGSIFKVDIYNLAGSTLIARFDPSGLAQGASYTDTAGHVWAPYGATTIAQDSQISIANRPAAAAANVGAFYIAEDDVTDGPAGTLYLSNGSSWSVVPRTLHSMMGWYDCKAYGQKSDRTRTTATSTSGSNIITGAFDATVGKLFRGKWMGATQSGTTGQMLATADAPSPAPWYTNVLYDPTPSTPFTKELIGSLLVVQGAGPAVTATLTTTLAGADNDLVYSSKLVGAAGNAITITYLNPGSANQAESVTVVSNAITVHLATNGASAITSTAASIYASIIGTGAAAALVSVAAASGTVAGAGVVTAMAATNLAGGSGNGVLSAEIIGVKDANHLRVISNCSATVGNPTPNASYTISGDLCGVITASTTGQATISTDATGTTPVNAGISTTQRGHYATDDAAAIQATFAAVPNANTTTGSGGVVWIRGHSGIGSPILIPETGNVMVQGAAAGGYSSLLGEGAAELMPMVPMETVIRYGYCTKLSDTGQMTSGQNTLTDLKAKFTTLTGLVGQRVSVRGAGTQTGSSKEIYLEGVVGSVTSDTQLAILSTSGVGVALNAGQTVSGAWYSIIPTLNNLNQGPTFRDFSILGHGDTLCGIHITNTNKIYANQVSAYNIRRGTCWYLDGTGGNTQVHQLYSLSCNACFTGILAYKANETHLYGFAADGVGANQVNVVPGEGSIGVDATGGMILVGPDIMAFETIIYCDGQVGPAMRVTDLRQEAFVKGVEHAGDAVFSGGPGARISIASSSTSGTGNTSCTALVVHSGTTGLIADFGYYDPASITALSLDSSLTAKDVEIHDPLRNYATAAPTTGSWLLGERVWNSSVAAAGDPIGWVCVTAGTPGTWLAFGALGAPVISVAGRTGIVTLAESDITNLVTDLAAKLLATNNLSDLANAGTARTNLGLGSLATKSAVASADITDGTIVDADINAAAAISVGKVKQVKRTPSGLWLAPSTTASTLLMVQNKAYAIPIDFFDAQTVTAIGLEITIVGAASSVIRLGIANDNNGVPGTYLLDAGTIDGTVLFATTPGKVGSLSQAVGPARIWLIAVSQAQAGTQPTVRSASGSFDGVGATGTNPPGNVAFSGYAETGTATTGALSGSFPANSRSAVPLIQVKT